jgi:hypothetical protein
LDIYIGSARLGETVHSFQRRDLIEIISKNSLTLTHQEDTAINNNLKNAKNEIKKTEKQRKKIDDDGPNKYRKGITPITQQQQQQQQQQHPNALAAR